jgi:uncharacterized protein
MNDKSEMIIAAILLAATASTAAYAQRDPAYQSARDGGLVGEKTDGYLGFVVAPSPAIKALVDDLNIKRKAAYTKEAAANNATVEEMALRNGCRLIAERSVAGEKYQLPNGNWATRTASAPALDARCPT